MSSESNVAELMETTGGFEVPPALDDFARKWVQPHYLLALAVIIGLTLVVIWLAAWKGSESFNPTQTLRDQDGDQFGLGSRENLEDRASSAFAQTVQTPGGLTFTVDPNAAANQPGSLGYQILNSAEFDCANRVPVTDDAWAWMGGVSTEGMTGAKPKNDNDFSRVLAGR